jgi:hypothetical protein
MSHPQYAPQPDPYAPRQAAYPPADPTLVAQATPYAAYGQPAPYGAQPMPPQAQPGVPNGQPQPYGQTAAAYPQTAAPYAQVATSYPQTNAPYPQSGAPYPQPGAAPQPYQPPAPFQGAPQQYPGYGVQPAPAGESCRLCGNGPAIKATARAHRGMIVMMQFRSLKGPFCRDCGTSVVRKLTADTLVQGWWGPASLFIFTPLTLIANLVMRLRLMSLDAPRPMRPDAVHPADPGQHLFLRWQIIGLALPLILLIVIVASSLAN